MKVRTARKVNTNLATMAVYYKMHDKHKIDCVHVYVQVKQYYRLFSKVLSYFIKWFVISEILGHCLNSRAFPTP